MAEELKEASIEIKKEMNEDPLELFLTNADLLHYYDAFSDVDFTIDTLLSFDNDTFISYVKDAFGMNNNEIDRLKRAINILKKSKKKHNSMDDEKKTENIVNIENIKQFCEHHKIPTKHINDFNDNKIDLNDLFNFTENELNEYVIKPFNMNPLHIKRLKQGIKLEKIKQGKWESSNKTMKSELQLLKYMATINKGSIGIGLIVNGLHVGTRAAIPAVLSSQKSYMTAIQSVIHLGKIGINIGIPVIGGLLSFGVDIIALTLEKRKHNLTNAQYIRLIKKSSVYHFSCTSCVVIGGGIGSIGGPIGCLIGTLIGLCVGLAAGYISEELFDKYRPMKV